MAQALVDDDVVGMLAREVREPLATIAGWAKLLGDGDVRGEEEMRQALRWIERTAAAHHAVLGELLDTLDTSGENGNGLPSDVDLYEYVLKALANVARAPDRNRLTVTALPSPGEALVRFIPLRLERVIQLFLQRALDGTPHNGVPVSVRVWAAAGEAVVDVETPESALIPSGWELRMTLAARLIRERGGSLVLNEKNPSIRVRLPIAPAGGGGGRGPLAYPA